MVCERKSGQFAAPLSPVFFTIVVLIPMLSEVCFVGVSPICLVVALQSLAVGHCDIGHEEQLLMLPAFVERYQAVASDPRFYQYLHDAHIFQSREGNTLVDHCRFFPR